MSSCFYHVYFSRYQSFFFSQSLPTWEELRLGRAVLPSPGKFGVPGQTCGRWECGEGRDFHRWKRFWRAVQNWRRPAGRRWAYYVKMEQSVHSWSQASWDEPAFSWIIPSEERLSAHGILYYTSVRAVCKLGRYAQLLILLVMMLLVLVFILLVVLMG